MTTKYPLVLNGTSIQELQTGDTISWNLLDSTPTTINGYGITLTASDIPNLDATKITSGVLDAARLPSYVDDVLEYSNLAGFPVTGEAGKIYIALDTNKTYRWSGSVYIYITSGAVDSVAGKTGVVTLVKGDVGLGNVENTALSTWAGSTNITTLGTITTGTWNATTISVAKGGTGATDAATARTNLGVAIGSNVQAWDADLDAIASLAGTSGFLKKTAANTWSLDTNTYLTGITSGQVTTALGYTPYNSTNPNGYTTNTGTVTSVGMTVPTGLSVSGTPITSSGTLAISLASGYSIPTTASQTNWDTAYTDRNKWDGGSANLVAATGRTSLGGTTVGQNFFTLTNPSAITFPRVNADNTVSMLDAATFRSAIGAGTPNIPAVGTKTSSYTLTTADVGKYVQVGTGGSITIPDATFAEGDAIVIFNNTAGNITITCTITTAYIAGTNTDKATVTLATRGVANILFISGTVCVVTGNVS